MPKTLIFAKTDSHADDIIQIVREEFGEGNDFWRKITYSADNPESVLSSLRNDYHPRIAVTVDMIAIGTDVKPTVSMKELMMNVAPGAKDEETLTSLVKRVIRLNNQMSPAERKQFEATVGTAAGAVAENLLNAFDEDVLMAKAQADTGSADVTKEQMKQAQKELIQIAVAPFHDPDIRGYIENVRRSHDQIIDNVNIDSVVFAGFDAQQEKNADRIIATFHEFIEENKDEILVNGK